MSERRMEHGLLERAANTVLFARRLLRDGLPPVRFPAGLGGPALDADTIVVVPSTVRPAASPLSYGLPRSLVPPEVRVEQTAATLASVRGRLPEAAIVLVEASTLEQDERFRLEPLVDRLLDLSVDPRAARLRDSRSKSAGEAYLLLAARALLGRSRHRLMLKLSARYQLTERFQPERFPPDRVGYALDRGRPSARLYSVPAALGERYEARLRVVLRRALAPRGRAVEEVLFSGLPAQALEAVGVRGVLGAHGREIDE